jgi:SAM-dependent methyltransferase
MTPRNPLNDEVRAIWDRNADFWDERMGDGNRFHKLLIEPAQLELLQIVARKMADSGARIVAIDVSAKMIENAKARSAAYGDRIDFQVCDCTDRELLLSLG